ncbi:hypothetical protein ABFA07_008272 [Porites harrisoni]
MSENYGRMVDLFRRFDSDNSGQLSYEEFADGMRELGAPATQVEIYIIAMALDSDGDQQLDYREFKKLSRRLKLGSERIRKTAEKEDNEETPTQQIQLRSCPNCNVGLWEPIVEDVLGYIMLDLRGLPFQNITSLPGQISAQVPSNISIYGISLIVKRELGPCTLNIRIYQPRETGDKEEMEASMKLRDFGYVGTLPPHEPQPVTLFYDYDYPMLDCPLLMADFSV